jgi:hypothetical protein
VTSKSVTKKAISWAIPICFLAAALVLFLIMLNLLTSSSTTRELRGGDYAPEMLVLSSQPQVTVVLKINYYVRQVPSDLGLGFGPAPASFPTGVREIELEFSGGTPGSTLLYNILLSKDAAEKDVTGLQEQRVYTGQLTGTISDTCAAAESSAIEENLSSMNIGQFLYGSVMLNSQGNGTAYTSGELANQHAYLAEGDDDIVNVISINSIATAFTQANTECAVTFPQSREIQGVGWYSPRSLDGEVTVGGVGSNYSVESASPALADLAMLSWQVSGPTAINYILLNNSLVQSQSSSLFWAGVLAALTAALLVDGLKGIAENVVGSSEGGGKDGPSSYKTRPRSRFVTFMIVAIPFVILMRVLRWLLRKR